MTEIEGTSSYFRGEKAAGTIKTECWRRTIGCACDRYFCQDESVSAPLRASMRCSKSR
jgi:hypothetical protein